MTRCLAAALLIALTALPLHAQTPVIDVAAIAELILIVEKVADTLDLIKEEYQTIQRLAHGFGGSLDGYKVPAVASAAHDPARYAYARLLLEGLNTGDPRGERYTEVMRRVDRPGTLFDTLPPNAKKALEVAFAGLEITDSVATLGVHESALARGYAGKIAGLIDDLEGDVTAPGHEYHEATAIADKIAIAGLINARQNQNSNQVESSILEQLLARNMRMRNAAAAHSNMTLTTMKDKGALSGSMVSGATDALTNWSLP